MKVYAIANDGVIFSFVTEEIQKQEIQEQHPNYEFYEFEWHDFLETRQDPPMAHYFNIVDGELVVLDRTVNPSE